jgi:hypothetical membrane protein
MEREVTSNLPRAMATVGIVAFTLAAMIGPFVSHPGYSSVRHSLSELAGQDMPNAWIMRGGFVAFGVAVLFASLARFQSNAAVFGALSLFGAAMLAAAHWSHLPISPLTGGSQGEDQLHSMAAMVMGTAFAAACGFRLWTRRKHGVDWIGVGGLLVSTIIPAIMVLIPDIAGAVQRMMFLASFVWILVVLKQEQGPTRSATIGNPP